MKKLLVAALAASFGFGLVAEEGVAAPKNAAPEETAKAGEEPTELEEKDDFPLEAGFDVDLFTAYVWRNTPQSDRPIAQPCAWADWTVVDPFYIGFFVWQNYDLTNRRRHLGYRGEWNETDYNIHAGTALWTSDDEESKLNFEFGHEWYTYNLHGRWGEEDGGYRKRKDFPTTYELYAKLEFENPFVTPYAQISHEYNRVNGTHYELGLKKEEALSDLFDSENDLLSQLTVSGDVNVNFGCHRYLTYLYDGDPETGDSVPNGIGGITTKFGLTWAPCDHFSIGGLVAFTSVLGETARDEFDDMDTCCDCPDLVWGGIQAKFSF